MENLNVKELVSLQKNPNLNQLLSCTIRQLAAENQFFQLKLKIFRIE